MDLADLSLVPQAGKLESVTKKQNRSKTYYKML